MSDIVCKIDHEQTQLNQSSYTLDFTNVAQLQMTSFFLLTIVGENIYMYIRVR